MYYTVTNLKSKLLLTLFTTFSIAFLGFINSNWQAVRQAESAKTNPVIGVLRLSSYRPCSASQIRLYLFSIQESVVPPDNAPFHQKRCAAGDNGRRKGGSRKRCVAAIDVRG